MTVFGINGLQRQVAKLDPIASPHLVDDPRRGLCDESPEPDRDDERRPTRQSPKRRHIKMVPMAVADEHCSKIREGCLGGGRPLTPNGTGHVAEHRIREHTNAVEIDKYGRMAEKRQPITQMASSCLSTLARLVPRAQVGSCLALQYSQTCVVVREFSQVGERDLPGEIPIVRGDIRLGASGPMLELDIKAHPELLEVALQRLEVDCEFSRDGECLFAGERFLDSHFGCPLRSHTTYATLLRVRHRMPGALSLDRSQADYEDENPAEDWPFCSQPVETRLSQV